MYVSKQIDHYIASQPEPKRGELEKLHRTILKLKPKAKLWFLDGKNEEGKVVSNPNVGYGSYEMKYADGSTREFYRIGLSGNKTGISVFIMGIEDKKYLVEKYGKDLGKAIVTGYCIRFKSLKDINIDVLKAAVQDRFEAKN